MARPYIETYGSKEADGSPVRMAVMCPTTPIWQERVQQIVLRLVHEYGVDGGVYIDQIAAAEPKLCMNPPMGTPWAADRGGMKATGRCSIPCEQHCRQGVC